MAFLAVWYGLCGACVILLGEGADGQAAPRQKGIASLRYIPAEIGQPSFGVSLPGCCFDTAAARGGHGRFDGLGMWWIVVASSFTRYPPGASGAWQ
jgi:hypothetical protein